MKLGESGASIIESMVAFVLIAGAAATLYPLFTRTKMIMKRGDVKGACESYVREKLDKYRAGRPIDLAAAATAYGRPLIRHLSLQDLSDSSATGVGTLNARALANGGFSYAKIRYNAYYPQICNGNSGADLLNAAAFPAAIPPERRQIGVRECLGGDPLNPATAFNDATGTPNGACAFEEDRQAERELPGFRLYVKLELDTPWRLNQRFASLNFNTEAQKTPISAGTDDPRYSNTCPNVAVAPFNVLDGANPPASIPVANLPAAQQAYYDFNGSDEGIRVTVTGVIDLPPTIRELAGVPRGDWSRLTCRVTTVVRPPQQAARYYVSTDGRIFPISGNGLQGRLGAASAPFQSVYDTGNFQASGVQAIAVHPRNLSIYVLKAGSLLRYSNCGGVPINCLTSGNGLPDDGFVNTPVAPLVEYRVLPSIGSIGVNFRTGDVFGMTRDRTEVMAISTALASTHAAVYPGKLGWANVAVANPPPQVPESSMIFQHVVAAENQPAKPLRMATGRWTGFFMDPGGLDGYVSDLSTSAVLGGAASSSIYRITDQLLSEPIMTLGAGAIAFSK